MRPSFSIRTLLLLAASAAPLGACAGSTRVVEVQLVEATSDTFSLRVGQEARVAGTALRIAFLGVDNDSRCPSGLMCVWAGNAAVAVGVTAGTGPTVGHVLNTGSDPRSVRIGGLTLALVDLQPYPASLTRIPAAAYVATLSLRTEAYPPD